MSQALPRWVGPAAGLLAALAALGAAQLVGVVTGVGSTPVFAVGGAAVDAAPLWLKEAAIRWFGPADKPVLVGGVLVVLAGLSALLGALAMRRPRVGTIGILAACGVAAAAALERPDATPLSILPSLVAAVVGVWALQEMRDRAVAGVLPGPPPAGATAEPSAAATEPGWDRRAFLRGALAAGGFALTSAGLARVLGGGADVSASRAAVRLPAPATPAPSLPAGVDLKLPGLSPFLTPVRDFYRVDTALLVPRVPAQDWRLRVHGMVDQEIELDYADLLSRPLVETDLTLCCVSNEVGGPYVGNARWLGARLADLLAEAGVDPSADQLLSTSADGWTCGTPTGVVMDGREALLAVGMDGQPLPVEHGFPVRMVVPGLYGYVSATKWVVDLELTTFAAQAAYWVSRGWSAQAPVKTMTRIDTPRTRTTVPAGTVAVAGVAWAQHRGINGVQVRVDDGPWQPARLAAVPGIDTWRQWVFAWSAEPGRHTVTARAVDGTGTVQTGQQAPPEPNGATGWPSADVTVV